MRDFKKNLQKKFAEIKITVPDAVEKVKNINDLETLIKNKKWSNFQ